MALSPLSPKDRLSFQLGAPFIIFVILVLTILTYSTVRSYTLDREQSELIPQTIAQAYSARLSSFFDHLEKTLALISGSFESPREFSAEEKSLLADVLKENPAILQIVFYDTNDGVGHKVYQPTVGEVVYTPSDSASSTESTSLNIDPASESVHREVLATGNPSLSPLSFSIYNTPIVFWTYPLRDTEGNITGVMQATLDVSILWATLSESGDGDASLYVIDEEGHILAAKNFEESLTAVAHTNVPIVQNYKNGIWKVEEYDGLSGTRVLGFWNSIPPTNWALVAEVPLQPLEERRNNSLLIFAFFGVGFLLLILYELWTFRKDLLTPLSVFNGAVNDLSQGNYGARVTVGAKNELSRLAGVFNDMAGNIEQKTSSIVERLTKLLNEQEVAAHMLIRRDVELSKANEKLRELDQAKSEFVSIAAHQLRTPLSAVKWALKLLMDGDMGKLTADQQAILMKGYESNERMIFLVNDMLSVDRVESGKLRYSFVPLSVPDLIDNVLFEIMPKANQRHVSIVFYPPEGDVPKVYADPEKIRSVIQNLIDNAVKYTMEGGKVEIKIAKKGDLLEMWVSDNGIGIPDNQKENIFNKFFRARNALKVETDGSGLGLFIVKQIVERHNGTIRFESEEGKGTTFIFTLPAYTGKTAL